MVFENTLPGKEEAELRRALGESLGPFTRGESHHRHLRQATASRLPRPLRSDRQKPRIPGGRAAAPPYPARATGPPRAAELRAREDATLKTDADRSPTGA